MLPCIWKHIEEMKDSEGDLYIGSLPGNEAGEEQADVVQVDLADDSPNWI